MKRTTQSTPLFPGRSEVAVPDGADRVRELCFIVPALVAASSAEPANQKFMNIPTTTDRPVTLPTTTRFQGTAPSLRVPVTAGNRALLRWMRTAELSAWQNADRKNRRLMRLRPDPTAQFCVA